MTKQTEFDHPPRGHGAILGYDSANDQWQAAYVNASGQLVIHSDVDLSGLLAELQQKLEKGDLDLDAAGRLSVNQHQYYGGSWRKSNLAFGIYSTWYEEAVNLSAGLGSNYLELSAVGTGYLHVATILTAINANTNPTVILMGIKISGNYTWLFSSYAPGAGRYVPWSTTMIFDEGWTPSCLITGCAAGDDIYFKACGYKIKTNM